MFCSETGIQISYTPPYTPQMNGVAERMNQTLMDRARCMIKEAGINKCFWEDAVLMAAYINNRTQSCLIQNKSPFELWLERGIQTEAGDEDRKSDSKEDKEKDNKKDNEGVPSGSTQNGGPRRVRKLPGKYDIYELDAAKCDEELDISCLALLSELTNAPKSYSEAKESSEWSSWKQTIEDELDALKNNNTWELVEKTCNQKVISNRWVFRLKENDVVDRLINEEFDRQPVELTETVTAMVTSSFNIWKLEVWKALGETGTSWLTGLLNRIIEKAYDRVP
ncbi:uncharacterized protein [Diabrotica undecimpunctata]|uniref:uncharacterized protein n=1 Tax=Diabrotica undecimpunctata TaxID=50387 RepID=UPI003B632F22